MSRRIILLTVIIFCCGSSFSQTGGNSYFTNYYQDKRIVVIMFDGFGMSYFNHSSHPVMDSLIKTGFYKEVNALMPTVTNCNNAAICTGTFPDENGITANSFLNAEGQEEYMESKELVMAPTLFERLKQYDKKSLLISSKKKTVSLLSAGTSLSFSAEAPDSLTHLFGQPPSIYSAEINYWSMLAALFYLQNAKNYFSCLYIHTTDYPMHTWAPEDSNSQKHIAIIDRYIGKIHEIAPDAIILITADHDVNHKSRCVDIEKSLEKQGVKIKIAISAERDKYLVHHRGFGGVSFVYLNSNEDALAVKKALLSIRGVKTVLTKKEAAKKYHLLAARIGDLVVLGDSATVFGDLDTPDEMLPDNYRTHGSEYEMKVPLMIFNADKLPPPSFFLYNKDLVRWLFEPIR